MGENDFRKRNVAFKISIKDILSGEYIKEAGEFSPSYIVTSGAKVTRVNLIGVVVGIDSGEGNTYQSIFLDDGSDKISVRSFEKGIVEGYGIGDIIMVVGRVREYNKERYVSPEIARKLDPMWMKLRKFELSRNSTKQITEQNEKDQILPGQRTSPTADVFSAIRGLDYGDGADMAEVIGKIKVDDGESIMKRLLESGEIFEVRPGKVKIL